MKCLHRCRPFAVHGFVAVWFKILLGALQTGATGTMGWYTWRAGVELPQAEAELKAAGYSLDVVENASPDVPDEGNFGAAEPLKGIATRDADQTPEIKERLAVLKTLSLQKRAEVGALNAAQMQDHLQKGQPELNDVPGGLVKGPPQKELIMPDIYGDQIDWAALREWIADGLQWEMPVKDVDDARTVLAALRLRMEPVYPALLAAATSRKHAAWTPGQRSRFTESVQRADVALEFYTIGGSIMPLLRILQLRQEAALACGMEEEAADLTNVLFACRDLSIHETSLIDFLVRTTVDQMIIIGARRSISAGKFPPALLAEYQTFFVTRPYAEQFDRALRMELATGQYRMEQIVKQKGSSKAFPIPNGLMQINLPRGWAAPVSQAVTRAIVDRASAMIIRDYVTGLQALKSGGMPGYYRWAKESEKRKNFDPLDLLRPHYLLAAGVAAGCSALMPGTIYKEMSRRVFVVECALERHRLARGTVPETLDALPKELLAEVPLDLDGKPIRYRREKTAWVLWSVGLDLVDEMKPDAPMYPPKAGTRIADPHLATDWRWWHLNP